MTNPDTCTATKHGTERAHRYHHCRCPEVVAMMHARWAERHRRKMDRRQPAVRRGPMRGWLKGSRSYDHVAVLRAVLGDKTIRLSGPEKLDVARRLGDRGWTARRIAEHVGVSRRTVERWRSHLVVIARAA